MSNEITFISDEDVVVIKFFAYIVEREAHKTVYHDRKRRQARRNYMNNDANKVMSTKVESEKTAVQPCMKEDLLALQSNMNKLLTEQNETFKEEIKLLRNLIEPCTSYIQRFNDFEKRLQENLANLNMQSLIFEGRLCKLEKYVDKNQISKK